MLFLTALLFITYMALIPDYKGMPSLVSFSDLLNHFAAFFTLFILMRLGFPELTCNRRFILLLGYAIAIEILQYFLPTRAAEVLDVTADATGLIVGLFVTKLLRRYITNTTPFSL